MASTDQTCSWKLFVTTQPPETLAKRIREDSDLVNDGKTPSLTVYYMPETNTPHALAIATHLVPSKDLSIDTKFLLYENLLNKIRRYLEERPMSHRPLLYDEDGCFLRDTTSPADQTDQAAKDKQDEPPSPAEEAAEEVSPTDLSVTLKVLQHLQRTSPLGPNTPISTAIAHLQQLLHAEPPPGNPLDDNDNNEPTTTAPAALPSSLAFHTAPRSHQTRHPQRPRRLCYICRLAIPPSSSPSPGPDGPHPLYPCLCRPCGAFNLSQSALSAPPSLTLPPTFAALVTGARVNLGYRVALRLLRCGARVVATSRYPRDAARRYADEGDFAEWAGRLRVLGADFRCARDAFKVVEGVRGCLGAWAGEGEGVRLGLVVNNAAQTLTDSVEREEGAVGREAMLEGEGGDDAVVGRLVVDVGYEARVRGGVGRLMVEDTDGGRQRQRRGLVGLEGEEQRVEAVGETGLVAAAAAADGASKEVQAYTKSSWMQSIFEIPYEDVISAHAVNTFVPLILCRELLPLMGDDAAAAAPAKGAPPRSKKKPLGYIINVSSREGIFEAKADSAKKGRHVHTNMSKAALNMITETEAATAWQTRRVAMNTVDPGYMSAAPEYEDAYDGVRPIGWEDGAGRVLWPIAMGEREGEAVWGRFLKHYGAVHVDPGVGRG